MILPNQTELLHLYDNDLNLKGDFNMIDWKTKLCSRKFWMAIIGFVTGLLTYLGVGVEQAEQIGSLILMGASVLAYVIGEGLADAAHAGNTVIVPGFDDDEYPDDEEGDG